MRVAIIDYGSGNLRSVAKAFEHAAQSAQIDATIKVTQHSDAVAQADRIVLPGVGAYADCLAGLKSLDGMVDALEQAVLQQGKPFFGICVGMQLLSTKGEEKQQSIGLDWIKGTVQHMQPQDPTLKVPQIGWNTLDVMRPHPLFKGVETGPQGDHAYFVHSYHFVTDTPQDLIATTDYGGAVTAVVGRDNMIGTQFHPEKSQRLGLTLIRNFLDWTP